MIDLSAFIHLEALVDEGASMGAQIRAWGFKHFPADAKISANCSIREQVLFEANVMVGDQITVKCGGSCRKATRKKRLLTGADITRS